MIVLSVNGKEIMKMSRGHLPFHTPTKSGDRAWTLKDEDTGEVIDSYSPPKPSRPKCQTRYEGSWAESMARRST